MQSKGAIRFVAILLVLACVWQLSFTLVSKIQNDKAEKAADAAKTVLAEDSEFVAWQGTAPEANVLDSLNVVRREALNHYTDSLVKTPVYFGYTFKDIQNKEINLGLDLKGGMNIMLQVQIEDVIKALAKNPSEAFTKSMAEALEASKQAGADDFLALLKKAWDANKGTEKLATVFASVDNNISSATSTDDDVIKYLSENTEAAIANSFNVLRSRIDRFGVTQPSIQKVGNSGRILIELPGVKDPERVEKLLSGTASLEFWETYTREDLIADLMDADKLFHNGDSLYAFNPNVLFDALEAPIYGGACLGYASFADTSSVNRAIKAGSFPADLRTMWSVKPSDNPGHEEQFELVALKASATGGGAVLGGEVVTDARVSYDSRRGGAPAVSMSMNSDGAVEWARITKQNIGHQIAIVLDGTVYSYPNVNGEITGGNSEITGNFDVDEATDLANVLKSGHLPAPAKVIQEQIVGPSLGQESINNGLISFVIAFILVLIYMLFFYQGAGVAADIALLTNVVLLFGTLASFGAVLTLPGIAGLVLTLGMAVDANVIIYERIKEELKAGKGLGKAVSDGYKNAYSAIIDGQVTTLLTGLVLFFFGSGPIKGFATTLVIGIITSVLTSIFITRLIFDDRIKKGKNITFENNLTKNFLKNTHINFIGGRKYSYIISGALIVIAIGSVCIKGFPYGVDFTGGRTFVVRFDQSVSDEDVRVAVIDAINEAADAKGVKATAEVKQFGGDNQVKITTSYLVNVDGQEATDEIKAILHETLKPFFKAGDIDYSAFANMSDEHPEGIISAEMVGESISNDIKRSAVISVLLALLIIFAYIAWRFKGWTWGIGGVVSLAHTAIIVIGFFSLFSGILPFNLDVDQTFIAAILTIIGYAINDNVVIFDRIRENLQLHPNGDFKENVNTSLNQTLTRTVNTSVSTLLPMIAIAIWGGESIRGFAVALILGICIGTYASIMIGTPIMYDATQRKIRKQAAKK